MDLGSILNRKPTGFSNALDLRCEKEKKKKKKEDYSDFGGGNREDGVVSM